MTEPIFSTKRENDHLISIEIGGQIDSILMEAGLETFWQVSKDMSHGGILMWDRGYDWPTIGAIGVELRHWWMMYDLVHRFDRVALMSASAFLKGVATVESALIPGLAIKTFDLDDEADARQWLAQKAPSTA